MIKSVHDPMCGFGPTGLAGRVHYTATAMKHSRYGNVHPHAVLPFVVEHAGGINKEGMQFFSMCRDAADNKLNARASGLSSWSSKGSSSFFLQSLSLANLKSLGLSWSPKVAKAVFTQYRNFNEIALFGPSIRCHFN